MITKLISNLRRGTLTAAGLGCAAGAAWTHTVWAGLLATGAALLVLDWSLDKS